MTWQRQHLTEVVFCSDKILEPARPQAPPCPLCGRRGQELQDGRKEKGALQGYLLPPALKFHRLKVLKCSDLKISKRWTLEHSILNNRALMMAIMTLQMINYDNENKLSAPSSTTGAYLFELTKLFALPGNQLSECACNFSKGTLSQIWLQETYLLWLY